VAVRPRLRPRLRLLLDAARASAWPRLGGGPVTPTEKVILAVSFGVAVLSAIALVLLRNPDGRLTRWIDGPDRSAR
jgi:hypothetical protein